MRDACSRADPSTPGPDPPSARSLQPSPETPKGPPGALDSLARRPSPAGSSGGRPYLHPLDLQLHVVLARRLAVLAFLPAVTVLPVLHLLAVVEDEGAVLGPVGEGGCGERTAMRAPVAGELLSVWGPPHTVQQEAHRDEGRPGSQEGRKPIWMRPWSARPFPAGCLGQGLHPGARQKKRRCLSVPCQDQNGRGSQGGGQQGHPPALAGVALLQSTLSPATPVFWDGRGRLLTFSPAFVP